MSARVDVLQNLLAPAETSEQDLTRPNVGIVASAAAKGSASDEANVARTLAKSAPEEKGGVGAGGVAECYGIVDNAERLLGRSSENGSQNTNAAGRFVDPIARHETAHPGLSNDGNDHQQQAEATERPRTPETKGADLRPTRTRPRSGVVDASTSALDRGPEIQGAPLGPTDEFDAMERINFDNFKGLSRPSSFSASRNEERWDEQKAGPRPAIRARSDELEELEVRSCRNA